MDGQQPLEKPRTIIVAVRLVYASIAISILSSSFWRVFWMSGLRGDIRTPVCSLTLIILVAVGMFYLASKISQGRKWARTLFTLLIVYQILGLLCSVPSLTTNSPTPMQSVLTMTDPHTLARISTLLQTSQTLLSLVSSLMSVVAILLLYRSDSGEYFAAADQRGKKIE
jgi:hypothetical protein